MLAAVVPFAIERGLVAAEDGETQVSIFMENTGQVAMATVATPGGAVSYSGAAQIDGVPGTHAPIPLEFRATAGPSCGALLPSGNPVDVIEVVPCPLTDHGLPCLLFQAGVMCATARLRPKRQHKK